MTTRLQTIENKLIEINPTVFQELCDSILIRRNSNYKLISRNGSVTGKQKTKKGTPDTLILLPDGKYLMIEYSTDISKGLKKLKEDILKNLDTNKTKIKIEDIKEMIICFNFNIKNDEIEELKQEVYDKGIALDVWNLDKLALEINSHHSDLAHQYLGMPIDTGQIVSLEIFIKEYNTASQGIAAPLNNKFLHRESELKEINEKLETSDFVIITGSPGVGKTKLALQVITNFTTKNLSYNAFAVSYKHSSLLDDLFSHLSTNSDNILLVDDANRIDAIQQIIGFYKASRKGKLKIILTVRDYALGEIVIPTIGFNKEIISLNKFSDEEIIDIIKEKPFEILNPRYQKEILRIADGNPRIAVMASMLAKEKQNLSALSDVSDLFERYFSTFISDKVEFDNKKYIKVLGIIAFFYAIPYKNRELLNNILLDFELDFTEFNEIIDRLDKLELVELQYDYVKIPEQNLATFFFYKAFIKDDFLSFRILLMKYFEDNKTRFNDTVIPANNTFGPENVMNKLQPALKEYFEIIKDDTKKTIDFLSYFWYYLQDEALIFLYNYINNLQQLQHQGEYNTKYETNDFAYNKDDIIELIGKLLIIVDKTEDVIELSIELIKKDSKLLSELIHKIIEVLTFDVEDERHNFKRQIALFDTLIKGMENGDKLYAILFFELSKTFIKNKFQQFKSGRHNSFIISQYPIPNNQIIRDFRKKIWFTTNKFFQQYSIYAFDFLKEFDRIYSDVINDILKFDIPYVINIINNNLESNNFHHCKYVHDQIWWFRRYNFNYPEFSELKEKFTNEKYLKFIKLDWDKLKDKDIYDFENFQEYDQLKEKELREYFSFNTLDSFIQFLDDLSNYYPYFKDNFNTDRIINILVDEICNKDFSLCLEVLKKLKENKYFHSPYLIFQNHLNNEEKINAIWELIQENEFEKKFEWEQTFFERIDENFLSKKWSKELLKSIKKNKKSFILFFYRFERYVSVYPSIFQDILLISTIHNEINENKISFWTEEAFSKYYDKLGDSIEIIKKAYKQQFMLQQHFDFENIGLLNILKKDPDFLVELIRELYNFNDLHSLSGSHLNFSNIWVIDNIEKQIEKIIEISIKNDLFFGIQEHFANTFFKNTIKEKIALSNDFIRKYIEENYSDPKKMLVILDIIKHSRKDLLEEMLLLYLSLNQNVDDFKRIRVIHHSGVFSGEIIIGDVMAGKWKEILEIVNISKLGIKLLPIKSYIKKMMEQEIESGNKEKLRKFISKY